MVALICGSRSFPFWMNRPAEREGKGETPRRPWGRAPEARAVKKELILRRRAPPGDRTNARWKILEPVIPPGQRGRTSAYDRDARDRHRHWFPRPHDMPVVCSQERRWLAASESDGPGARDALAEAGGVVRAGSCSHALSLTWPSGMPVARGAPRIPPWSPVWSAFRTWRETGV